MPPQFRFFLALFAAVQCCYAVVNPNSVSMTVVNQADQPIELFWVPPRDRDNQDPVKQSSTPIRSNSRLKISSFDTHQFMVKFHDDQTPSSSAVFVKGPKEETVTVSYSVEKGFQVAQRTRYHDVVDNVNAASASCQHFQGDAFSVCLANLIAEDVVKIADEKSEMKNYNNAIANRLRNYTCADDNMWTTSPIRTVPMTALDKQYNLDILFDTPHAKIWAVEDFITDEECRVLEKHGKPKLARATVAAEDGTSTVSNSRKAQQAHYDVPMSESDPLWNLYNRILSVTTQHTGYNLQIEGQEGFTIIQYNPGDEYLPHCDGSCDGSKHIDAGRVATTVLYCTVADRGGATSFTKADVFVRPKRRGAAAFFSYMGSDGLMDPEGLTEHSACPVLSGEKWVSAVWMREGVTKDRDWTKFDPSGVAILDSSAVPRAIKNAKQFSAQAAAARNTQIMEDSSESVPASAATVAVGAPDNKGNKVEKKVTHDVSASSSGGDTDLKIDEHQPIVEPISPPHNQHRRNTEQQDGSSSHVITDTARKIVSQAYDFAHSMAARATRTASGEENIAISSGVGGCPVYL